MSLRSGSEGLIGQGVAAARARRFGEAIELFRSAVSVDAENALAHENLGKALRALGRVREALPHMAAALARAPDLPDAARVFALYAADHGLAESADAAKALLAALRAPGVDGQGFALPALRQWRAVAVEAFDAGRRRGWDDAAGRLLRRPHALAHPLLEAVLAECVVCDAEAELLLTAVRRRLALAGARRPNERRLAELLAAQARNNACAWAETVEEREVREATAARMYRPEMERPAFAGPRFGDPADAASREVAAQYEESPYPRWRTLTTPRPGELREALRRLAPARDWSGPLELLIAGCGTGRQAVAAALGYAPARVLACDLSAASLGWAARRAAQYGVENIELLQADLRDAPRFGRRFDVIECAGVLHHMVEPEEGWRRLLEALAPDGLMLVGLYSETARRPVVAARAEAARLGFAATDDDIRRFRRHVLTAGDDWAQEVRRNPDFYDLCGARDMLFHVNERRFTPQQIAEMLARLGLRCLGMEAGAATAEAYRRRFPDDAVMRSLENWAVFEVERPRTFRGMYQFWCARR